MRIVFMGSAAFACPALDRLIANPADEVVGVVTQPDRPQGRGRAVEACPVKAQFVPRGLRVVTPERVSDPAGVDTVRALKPDLIVVVAYGQILRPAVLAIPPLGCINLHGSLLPKYRGAAPIAWAIARGEQVTGVTTMFMNERMDEGDVLRQASLTIAPDDTCGTLQTKLAQIGADLLEETIEDLRRGTVARLPQNDAEATLAPKLKKTDGRIDWALPAATLVNRIRAFNPWPCCTCALPGAPARLLRVLRGVAEPGEGRPGTVLDAHGEGPLVQAGDGAVRLIEVQPEGRRPMSGRAFLQGNPLTAGERMG